MTIILASASPRRAELLHQIGLDFQQMSVDIDETPSIGEKPADYVERMAREKAQAAQQLLCNNTLLVAADTSVVCDGVILGKPSNQADSRRMLKMLSGNTHKVMTAVAVASGAKVLHQLVTTEVSFRELTEAEIESYWLTKEPADKAGSYGIQGIAAKFVSQINGSYSGVVGLPLMETEQLIKQMQQESH